MQHPLEDVADGEEAEHPVLLVRVEIWEAGMELRMFWVMLLWASITPFGRPVVPEV